jgi:RNA polymerase sigma-70 factor (ECF subfamily)
MFLQKQEKNINLSSRLCNLSTGQIVLQIDLFIRMEESREEKLLIPADAHELIGRAKSGDTEAFRRLFEQYKQPVFNFIVRMTGHRQDAEDILQEVFVKVYRNLSALRDAQAFKGWLFSTAKNESINHLRKHRQRQLDSLEKWHEGKMEPMTWNDDPHHANPEHKTADAEMQEVVQRVLNEVPEIYRVAFILGVLEGYSYKEVAKILGCSVNNVKSRVFRARAMMSQKLRPYFQAQ